MSGYFEEELENIKASLKHLGAIEESLVSDNYLESRSVSDLESHTELDTSSKFQIGKDWTLKTQSDMESEPSYMGDRNFVQTNEIIKEKSNLINRLYNCIEELKGEIQELTSTLDYHMQVNADLEKELEFYRYSKEPNDNYDVQYLQSEYKLLKEKYDEAMSQLRSSNLRNAELTELLSAIKSSNNENTPSSIFQTSGQYSGGDYTAPRYPESNQTEEVCTELSRELQVSSIKDILARVIHLKEYYSHSKEFRKLYKKLAETMIKKVGRHNVSGLPSCINLWKWVNSEFESFAQVLKEAGVKNYQELMDKVRSR